MPHASPEERRSLKGNHNPNCLSKCFNWMSKPLNVGGATTIAAGAAISALSVILPEDGLKDSPGYMILCLTGVLVFTGGVWAIRKQHQNDLLDEAVSSCSNCFP